MGQKSSHAALQEVTKRTEGRVGKIAVSGRYHRAPKKLEDDYVMEPKVLGSGYNGSVHLAKDKTGAKFAVKGFKLHGVSKEKKEELESECEIFLAMDHPHVARLTDVYESEDALSLVMECMEGGELFHRVTERKRFSEKDASEAAFQMLLAVNYIHTHGVVHRDIKLENFLYEKKDSDHLKLIDFGFSKIWEPNTKMALSCGTLAYVAPEVLEKNYTSQCDLWSLGVVVFILLVGYMPFAGTESHQVKMIKEGKYTKRKDAWARVSKEADSFVSKLLVVNPEERMSAQQALEHDWIHKRDQIHQKEDHLDQATVEALTNFAQASSFRRACMSVMAWSLTAEDRAGVREAFLELDKDHKGTISMQDFKKVLETRYHMQDEQVKAAFGALHPDHNEEVHYSDFLAAMASSRIRLHDSLLMQTFRRFDVDNTGFITRANLTEVLGESFEGHEVEKLLDEADVSHDGKISYQEFIEYLKNPQSEAHHDAAHKVVDNLVRKSDGPAQPGSKSGGMKRKDGAPAGKGAAPKAKAQAKQQSCCVVV